MTFQYPWVFVLLLLLIPLAIRQFKLKPPALRVSSLKHFTGQIGTDHRPFSRFLIPVIFEFLALICLIIALARPRTGHENSYSFKEGVDIVFSLDTSPSMSYYDQPSNIDQDKMSILQSIEKKEITTRLNVSKNAIANFIDQRKSDRLGLVVFGTEAYSICPPTNDHLYLKNTLSTIENEHLKKFSNQTNITAAISGGVARLRKSKAPKKILILVTDGSQTADTILSPLKAAEAASKSNTIIYTIGVGNKVSWAYGRDYFNRPRVERTSAEFDEELLKKIAEITSGHYFPVRQPEEMEKVLKKIDELEKVELKHFHSVNYAEHFHVFLWFGIALLVSSAALSHSVFMRYP